MSCFSEFWGWYYSYHPRSSEGCTGKPMVQGILDSNSNGNPFYTGLSIVPEIKKRRVDGSRESLITCYLTVSRVTELLADSAIEGRFWNPWIKTKAPLWCKGEDVTLSMGDADDLVAYLSEFLDYRESVMRDIRFHLNGDPSKIEFFGLFAGCRRIPANINLVGIVEKFQRRTNALGSFLVKISEKK